MGYLRYKQGRGSAEVGDRTQLRAGQWAGVGWGCQGKVRYWIVGAWHDARHTLAWTQLAQVLARPGLLGAGTRTCTRASRVGCGCVAGEAGRPESRSERDPSQ
jgi:hypothetical protein